MRMQLAALFLALSLLLSCMACGGEGRPTPPAAETPQAAEPMTAGEAAAACARAILDSQPDGGDYRPLSPEDVEFYLSEVYAVPEGSRGTAAVVYTAGGVDARELAVLYGTDSTASNAAAAALEGYRRDRAGDFTGYAPEQEELVKRGLVMEGNMALLAICTDPEAAQRAMEEDLSPLVITRYDPAAPPPEGYDWTEYVDERGFRRFDPPNAFPMTPYDTAPILAAWESGDGSGLSEKDAAVLAKCREALEACVEPGMSDFEKELALHDWLVEHCAYDRTVYNAATPLGRENNLDPYGALVEGYGVCLGYATAFRLLMDLAGVECITVVGASSNSSQDHAWNMVRLEGEWYCVDPTWNDPAGGYPGMSQQEYWHRYFNVTSAHMRETDHQWDYDSVPEAAATRFFWAGTGELPT